MLIAGNDEEKRNRLWNYAMRGATILILIVAVFFLYKGFFGNPLEEIKSAKLILKTLGLRTGGIEVVSCPTCGRTRIDLISLANQVETMVAEFPLDIKVAVMGCVVNGPGEAKEADIGIAGGIGEGLLIKKGEIIRKVKEEELLDALRDELVHWGE